MQIHRSFSNHVRWTTLLWGLALSLLTALWLPAPIWAAPLGDDIQVEIDGVVVTAPIGGQGNGLWVIQPLEDAAVTMTANPQTEFDKGIPHVGQRVQVRGLRQPDGTVLAQRMTREDGQPEGMEVKGVVITAPADPAGVGEWTVRVGRTITWTVIADAATQFRGGQPRVGQWMQARGVVQSPHILLATLIRPEDYEQLEVVVRLNTGVISQTVASRYSLSATTTLLESAHIYLFTATQENDDAGELAPQLAQDGDVVWAEPNYLGGIPEGNPYTTWKWGGQDESGYVNQAAFEQVNLAPALALYDGAGVVVAVLDTGVDLTHPALSGRLLPGWDMVADDALPQDEGDGLGWGHGTHVAGIIARMAPQAQILPVRVLDTQGRGNTFVLAYAIEWAVLHGADVINLSLGTDFDSRTLHEAVERAADRGVVVVAAAGNNQSNAPQYPAAYERVLAVTGVDGANRKADFANFGPWVDLAAPAVGITSTLISAEGSGYASWNGTSMATAFVSGAAALARQQTPTGPPQWIANRLRQAAGDLDPLNPDYPHQLGRLLDVGAALVGDVVRYTFYFPLLVVSSQ